MKSDLSTIEEYLASLPEDRRTVVSAVREVILRHLPEGYSECMQFGMIGYAIPLSRYPKTYNGQPLSYVALASQKNYISLYLMGVYCDQQTADWFRNQYLTRGMKLNMGKSCVRFKRLEELPLDLVGEAVALLTVDEYIERYEQIQGLRA